jgi:hypothetical protein
MKDIDNDWSSFETSSFTLRREGMLRVLENEVLRSIFRPRRHEVTEWRQLQNEELQSL